MFGFQLLCFGLGNTNPVKVYTHLVVGEDENSVEPLPEGEVSLWQRLLAEHGPTQVQLIVFIRVSERSLIKSIEIYLGFIFRKIRFTDQVLETKFLSVTFRGFFAFVINAFVRN